MLQDKLAAAEKLKDILDKWTFTPAGEVKDIRALLSSLHTVLWENSGWQQVTIGDLLGAGSVKKAYRKATLLVHPDKHQNDDGETQYRADRIFDAIQESFKGFSG